MQHLSGQGPDSLRSVDLVAQNGVPKMMKMHADLVGPATVDPALHQTGLICFARDPVLGPGSAPARDDRGHALTVDGVPGNGRIDRALLFFQSA
jgi:hypothetical protein